MVTEDAVYMDDEELIDEYVVNDTGKIYNGNSRQIYGRPWNFGQVCIRKRLTDKLW